MFIIAIPFGVPPPWWSRGWRGVHNLDWSDPPNHTSILQLMAQTTA